MSKQKQRCPLCSRHCPLESPRCRKGEKYARSLQQQAILQPQPTAAPNTLSVSDTLLSQLRLISRNPLLHPQAGSSRYRILSTLAERERTGQQQLKELLGVKSSSLSELLAKLEKKNLIKRKKNENDKRNRDIMLTEEGRNWLHTHTLDDNRSQLLAALTEDEKAQLSARLGKLLTKAAHSPATVTQTDTLRADTRDLEQQAATHPFVEEISPAGAIVNDPEPV